MRISPKQVAKNLMMAVAPKRTTELLLQEEPFRGLILTPMTHAEHLGPFLLGVYESELDPAWDVVLRRDYTQIVDVGAKFGYYAVGLARQYPNAEVVAFDTDPWARAATGEMARANGTAKVQVRGFCDPDWMRTALRPSAFVFSDCEGYEGALFTSEPIPHIATATLIIETHDEFDPGVTDRLRARLAATHEVSTFTANSPRRETTRDLSFLSTDERRLATHEVRGPQTWLLCTPNVDPATTASQARRVV